MRPGLIRHQMMRRSRALVASPRLWRARLVFWAGAIAIGLISAGFAVLADEAHGLFLTAFGDGWRRWLPLLVTPLGFIACAWAADRFFPGSQGSGIPQAIAARHLREDEDRGGYLTLRIVVGKISLTLAGLLAGASIGREGPTVQVGAAIMLASGRLGGMAHARGLILAGSAAGIAAAFNTPLAGIVFAIEEMSRAYQARTNGLVLSAVILAGVASLSILGSYTYFGVTHVSASFPGDWGLVAATGIAGGLLGALFSLATVGLVTRLRRAKIFTRERRLLLVAGSAGLIVAILGVATGGATFGTGYDQARGAIEGDGLPGAFFLAKFIATLASTVSGIPGGLFAPSLSVGAGLGSSISLILGASVTLGAILGMAGYFAGVVQAPLTTVVIVVEMTGNHENVVPIMAAAMLGYGVSRLISPEPLYHALSRLWIADAIRRRRSEAVAATPESPSS
ncbi:chloride channel protein [Frigidibacter sp. SD6-1]|uniref:chloride channel protein n=1 Tax=Frigidibacter sp. SD6-1 TaxID=3032581 RepID=UPI0024DFA6D3|nr:chloride channel protein [Frigidibacter sp. SD6-1]